MLHLLETISDQLQQSPNPTALWDSLQEEYALSLSGEQDIGLILQRSDDDPRKRDLLMTICLAILKQMPQHTITPHLRELKALTQKPDFQYVDAPAPALGPTLSPRTDLDPLERTLAHLVLQLHEGLHQINQLDQTFAHAQLQDVQQTLEADHQLVFIASVKQDLAPTPYREGERNDHPDRTDVLTSLPKTTTEATEIAEMTEVTERRDRLTPVLVRHSVTLQGVDQLEAEGARWEKQKSEAKRRLDSREKTYQAERARQVTTVRNLLKAMESHYSQSGWPKSRDMDLLFTLAHSVMNRNVQSASNIKGMFADATVRPVFHASAR